MTTLGERLRRRRKEVGWTQEQLGARSGTTQAVIQKIENGKSLRPRKIDEISRALGVAPEWLMFGAGNGRYQGLDEEAIQVATAWSRLSEPQRTEIKQAVLRFTQPAIPA